MATVNEHYDTLAAGYLFPEIAKRTNQFLDSNPDVKVMKLGIGNTTEPLTPTVLSGLHKGVGLLASEDTYTGYGDEQGSLKLRQVLCNFYLERYRVVLNPEEVFISSGAKDDSGNIQGIFGRKDIVAVQDPAYPVYVDSNVIVGRTRGFDKERGQYSGLVYMACNEDNGFVPSVPDKKVDLIYLCSPNNPTGAVMEHSDLEKFVSFAKKNKSIIIFDAAYSAFISEPRLPRSIYEVKGAKDCTIEINSFSKSHGFTGVRLGWTIVPNKLATENSGRGKVNTLWNRRQSTFFNGASNVIQQGGLAALSKQGMEESEGLVDFYMENARIIKDGLKEKGLTVFGGDNAPYLWMKTPNGMSSWDFFDKFLNEAHVVGTPGSGFGPSGEGFFRLSAFGHREDVESAVESIMENLKI